MKINLNSFIQLSFKLALIQLLMACTTSSSVQLQDKKGRWDIFGKWRLSDVRYTGDKSDIVISDKVSLHTYFGHNWENFKNSDFYFLKDYHWYSTSIDIDKKDLTFNLEDALIISIKNEKSNYDFVVPIIDSTATKMTWDIGDQIQLDFVR